jgi:hypothetical protein
MSLTKYIKVNSFYNHLTTKYNMKRFDRYRFTHIAVQGVLSDGSLLLPGILHSINHILARMKSYCSWHAKTMQVSMHV